MISGNINLDFTHHAFSEIPFIKMVFNDEFFSIMLVVSRNKMEAILTTLKPIHNNSVRIAEVIGLYFYLIMVIVLLNKIH